MAIPAGFQVNIPYSSSPLRLYGINHSLKACAPLESLLDESDKSNKHKPKRIPKCLPECELTEYVTNIRVNKLGHGMDAMDGAVLVLHYESFAYHIVTEYHESLTDFLCELQGDSSGQLKPTIDKYMLSTWIWDVPPSCLGSRWLQ